MVRLAFLHRNVRVILFVGHDSDRIASGPAWTQSCGAVCADDKVSRSGHSGQAPRLRDVLRNIITFRVISSQCVREQKTKRKAYTRPCVGSAPVKNWNVEKKLPPWYESTSAYGPAKEEDIDRVRRAINARSVMD
jgi:hypothetical protein